ncbi:MAG TPA: ABC transporter ATP-binding protein [Lachnospiraceae bacterium]|nr:ABC transporter ATP-binding protein [Lachnospiraceae bacterium]
MIEASDLTKTFRIPVKMPGISGAVRHLLHGEYKTKTAVDHVNFSIDQGEAVAYIGPNGAGKSTTIKMLTGILQPTSGTVLVNGVNPQKERMRNAKNIGVVFGQRTQLWWDIPVEESFALLKSIYEIPDTVYQENLRLFNEIFGLSEFMGKAARRLSLGQRMRADLAASLLHNPATIFLDVKWSMVLIVYCVHSVQKKREKRTLYTN